MDFVIKDITEKKDITGDIPEDIKAHISEYYDLKNKYYDFLVVNKTKKNTFDYMINGDYDINSKKYSNFRSNHPLRFLEKDGSLIIEVIDSNTRKTDFRKTIKLEESINIRQHVKYLVKELKKNNYSLSKLYVTKKISDIKQHQSKNRLLFDNSLISKGEYENTSKSLEKEYNSLREEYNKIKNAIDNKHIELDILNSITKSKVDDIAKTHSDLKLKNTFLYKYITTTKFNDIKENPENIPGVLEYYILERILYQKLESEFIPGYICTDNEEIYIISSINNDNTMTLIKNDFSKITKDTASIEKIEGLFYRLRNTQFNLDMEYVSMDDYRSLLSKRGIPLREYDYSVKVSIENMVNKNNLMSKQVTYVNIDSKKDEKPKKPKQKKAPRPKKNIVKEEKEKPIIELLDNNLFDDSTINKEVVLIIDDSLDSKNTDWAGKYEIEKLEDRDLKPYNNLNSQDLWRQKLSNNYLVSTSLEEHSPIVIDNIPFSSVKHYEYYSMYIDIPSIGGNKKAQHNGYAKKFTLNCNSEESFASLSGDALDIVGNSPDFDVNPNLDSVSGIKINDKQLSNREVLTLKAMFAKFMQNNEFMNILLYTSDSHLIVKDNGGINYKPAFNHMYIRYLLENKIKPVFYTNYESDYALYTNMYSNKKETDITIDLTSEIPKEDTESAEKSIIDIDSVEDTSVKSIGDSQVEAPVDEAPADAPVVESPVVEESIVEDIKLDSYKFYYTTISSEGKEYKFVFYHKNATESDDEINIPVGILDTETNRITYINYDDPVHSDIVDTFDTLELSLDDMLEYQVDSEGNVYVLGDNLNIIGTVEKYVEVSDDKFPIISFS